MSDLTGTVKTPNQRAGLCVRGDVSSWRFTCRCQREQVAWDGVLPDADQRPQWGQGQVTGPQCLLVVCWKGGMSVSCPFICQIEEGQGLEEDDPGLTPIFPTPLALGRACVCVCVALCVQFCFPGLCVSLAPVPQLSSPSWPLSCGPLSSGNRAGIPLSRAVERYPDLHRSGSRRRVAWERSLLFFVPNP